jgi:hypothetical protein
MEDRRGGFAAAAHKQRHGRQYGLALPRHVRAPISSAPSPKSTPLNEPKTTNCHKLPSKTNHPPKTSPANEHISISHLSAAEANPIQRWLDGQDLKQQSRQKRGEDCRPSVKHIEHSRGCFFLRCGQRKTLDKAQQSQLLSQCPQTAARAYWKRPPSLSRRSEDKLTSDPVTDRTARDAPSTHPLPPPTSSRGARSSAQKPASAPGVQHKSSAMSKEESMMPADLHS